MLVKLIDRFLEHCTLDKGLSSRTVYNYKYQMTLLADYFGDIPVNDIEISDWIKYFRDEEARGLATSSVNTARHTIRSFLWYCQEIEGIELGFSIDILKNKKVQGRRFEIADDNDITRVLEVLSDIQDKLIVKVLSQSCMRIGELVKLDVKDLNYDELVVTGKGSKPRLVFISSDLADELKEFLESRNRTEGPLFINNRGRRLTISGLRNRFIRKLSPYGLHAGFHWYRHGGATKMMRNGASLFFIKEYLGHSDIRTTQQYLHISDEQKKADFKKFYSSSVK